MGFLVVWVLVGKIIFEALGWSKDSFNASLLPTSAGNLMPSVMRPYCVAKTVSLMKVVTITVTIINSRGKKMIPIVSDFHAFSAFAFSLSLLPDMYFPETVIWNMGDCGDQEKKWWLDQRIELYCVVLCCFVLYWNMIAVVQQANWRHPAILRDDPTHSKTKSEG